MLRYQIAPILFLINNKVNTLPRCSLACSGQLIELRLYNAKSVHTC